MVAVSESLSQEGKQAFLLPGWAYGFSDRCCQCWLSAEVLHPSKKKRPTVCSWGRESWRAGEGTWLELQRGRGTSQSPGAEAEFGGSSRVNPLALLAFASPKRWGVAVESRGAEQKGLWLGLSKGPVRRRTTAAMGPESIYCEEEKQVERWACHCTLR